jgi:hypothetical protein
MSLKPMLALAAYYGGADGMDLIADFAARHPSDRIRWCALRARAAASPSLDARIAVYEEAIAGGGRLVGAMAAREVAKLEARRGWIEGSRPSEAAA